MDSDTLTHPATPELPDVDGEPTYYDLLQVAPAASPDEILAAYRRQQQLYDPAHAAQLGPEFLVVAQGRRAALDEAFVVLGDPERRFDYDRQLGLVGDPEEDRRGISNREVLYAVGGVLVALLILAGLWSALGTRRASGPAVSEVSYPAPPFTLRTLDGGRFDLAAYRGKVVLINFWATWCVPCREETPALQAAHQKLAREGLVIVGVDLFNGERDEEAVRQFVAQYGATYPIALDESGDVARAYRLNPIPVSYFVDPSGNVRYIRIGQLTTGDVEQLFRRLSSGVETAANAGSPSPIGMGEGAGG